ncbi:MAG TPA: YdcF family protein [Methylomirabilota bacterium]
MIALLLFAVAAFTPLANLINIWMAGVSHVEPSDAIVILGRGGADADDVLTNRSLRRLLRGVGLYHDGFAPFLVLSGSAGETRARMTLARGFRIPETAILTSAQARTTKEEAEEVAKLLLPLGQRRILLVADPIDMPRSRALMERAGFVVHPVPTAATGPSNPESRLGLLRDLTTELSAWAY